MSSLTPNRYEPVPASIVFAPTTATLTVLPPVSTAGLTASDASRLAESARGAIARALEDADERSP